MKRVLLGLALACRRTVSLGSDAVLAPADLHQATLRVWQLKPTTPLLGLHLVILLAPTKPELEQLAAIQGQSMSA